MILRVAYGGILVILRVAYGGILVILRVAYGAILVIPRIAHGGILGIACVKPAWVARALATACRRHSGYRSHFGSR